MREKEFEYGPVARGIYMALLAGIAVVPLVYPQLLLHYIAFMIFLGVGLRWVLETTGLYRLWIALGLGVEEKLHKKRLDKRAMEIDRQQRDEQYRRARHKDPKLPKNW